MAKSGGGSGGHPGIKENHVGKLPGYLLLVEEKKKASTIFHCQELFPSML